MRIDSLELYSIIAAVLEWLIAKDSLQRGQTKKAYHSLKRALRADPENYAAWADLAETCLRLGQFDEAHLFAQKAITISDSPLVLRVLALTLVCKGSKYEAERVAARIPDQWDWEWKQSFMALFEETTHAGADEKLSRNPTPPPLDLGLSDWHKG